MTRRARRAAPALPPTLLLLTLLGCGGEPAGGPADGPAESAPIVLVTLSGLRPDYVGALAGEAGWTPHIDAFAREADWVTTAVTASSVPVVSLVSLMTGVSPWQHQMLGYDPQPPRAAFPLLAQALGSAGYRTVAHVPLDYGLRELGLLDGFEAVADSEPIGDTAAALAELRAGELWWIHLREANVAFRRRDAQLPRLAARSAGLPAELRAWRLLSFADPRRPLPAAELAIARELFGHEVAWADHQLGELMRALHASGQWDRAWVVLTATQGMELGEHGQTLYAQNLGRASIEVPLLVKLPRSLRDGPALPRRRRVAQLRLWATLVEAAGGRPAPVQAPSLLRAADPPSVSELYLRNGVNEFSLVEGDLQLRWTTRFAPAEDEFYLAQLALAGGRPPLAEPPRRILDRLRKAFLRTPPFSGAAGGEPPQLRLERWTEDGVAAADDPPRAAELARRLRRSWRRFTERERTPEEESSWYTLRSAADGEAAHGEAANGEAAGGKGP